MLRSSEQKVVDPRESGETCCEKDDDNRELFAR